MLNGLRPTTALLHLRLNTFRSFDPNLPAPAGAWFLQPLIWMLRSSRCILLWPLGQGTNSQVPPIEMIVHLSFNIHLPIVWSFDLRQLPKRNPRFHLETEGKSIWGILGDILPKIKIVLPINLSVVTYLVVGCYAVRQFVASRIFILIFCGVWVWYG